MAAETITSITEYNSPLAVYGSEMGHQIITSKQTVLLAIDDEGSCCETWDCFFHTATEEFVGAELLGVERAEEALACIGISAAEDLETYEANILHVNIITDRGVLQWTAYNNHNGYYPHGVRVVSQQLKLEDSLQE